MAIENGPVEIVDFPINSMGIFHSYVKLPEGTLHFFCFAPPGVPEVPGPWRHRGRDPGSLAHHNAAHHHGVDDCGTGGARGLRGWGVGWIWTVIYRGFLKWGYYAQIIQKWDVFKYWASYGFGNPPIFFVEHSSFPTSLCFGFLVFLLHPPPPPPPSSSLST